MGAIDFFCTYEPTRGLYQLRFAGHAFSMSAGVFERARCELRGAASDERRSGSLSLDLGGRVVNLQGATRHEFRALLGIFDAAARGAEMVSRAGAN
jgi:hypothetical protein